MKKIMFNDRYGLTQAVLDGRKTMTRRIVRCPKTFRGVSDVGLEFRKRPWEDFYYDCVVTDGDVCELGQLPLPYELGEVVAVGQCYNDVIRIANRDESVWQFLVEKGLMQSGGAIDTRLCTCEGFHNKMFVCADLMPHRIRITDLWFEHLQDISDDDCLAEGIMYDPKGVAKYGFRIGEGKSKWYRNPKDAFSSLIDKVIGKGTWERNPWVYAYEFELIK